MLSATCFIVASKLATLKSICTPHTAPFTGIPTYQLAPGASTAALAALYAYHRRAGVSSITFVGGNMLSIVDFSPASDWFAVACIVMLDLLSGAAAELGENLSTTQSEGTEIWQLFDRS